MNSPAQNIHVVKKEEKPLSDNRATISEVSSRRCGRIGFYFSRKIYLESKVISNGERSEKAVFNW